MSHTPTSRIKINEVKAEKPQKKKRGPKSAITTDNGNQLSKIAE